MGFLTLFAVLSFLYQISLVQTAKVYPMMSLSGLKTKLESLLELTELQKHYLFVESDIMHHCFRVQELYQIPKADYKQCSSTLTVCCNTLKTQPLSPYRNLSWPDSDILVLLNFIAGLFNSWHSWKSKTFSTSICIGCKFNSEKLHLRNRVPFD